jgi:hypothetical protein
LCLIDYPVCSIKLELNDKTYLQEGLFTQQEINKTKDKNVINLIKPISKVLADYTHSFNNDNIQNLRL